ncbi:MAG: type IV secretion system protein VirB10 [Flavobacteriales bacterium]|nr:type IV secretion system protein VirB10 [Flavobacteriales bacterium]
MSSNNENVDSGNDDLDDDRGIPTVSKSGQGNGPFLLVVVILALVGSVLIYAYWPESSGGKELTDKTADDYDRENISNLSIRIPEDPPEPEVEITKTVYVPPLPDPGPSAEELARLQALEDLKQRRRRSPVVVYDGIRNGQLQQANSVETQAERQQRILAKINADAGISGTQAGAQLAGLGEPDTLAGNLSSTSTPGVKASYLENRQFTLTQGKLIGAHLETPISSDLPGFVRAIVSENVFSEDGRTLLVEKGSRLIGEYRAGLQRGKARIFVTWNRLITPFGIDVQLLSPGTDSLGRSGLAGWIDPHFFERFGSSFLLSIIGAAAAQSDNNDFAEALGENFNDSAAIALENSINIQPTFHKNQGDTVKVFIARDLDFKSVYALRSR